MLLKEIKVFHGTSLHHAKELNPPIFVTPNKKGARWFAINRNEDGVGQILEGELNVKNPLDITRSDGYKTLLDIAAKAGIEYTEDPYFECDEIAKHSHYDGSNPTDLVYVPSFVEQLKKDGYDSLRTWDTLENGEIEAYVLFDAKQFKITGSSKVEVG